MKPKNKNRLKYSSQEELLSHFREDKYYPFSSLLRISKRLGKPGSLKELFILVIISCSLLAGVIYLL